jgi:hypothetical protein
MDTGRLRCSGHLRLTSPDNLIDVLAPRNQDRDGYIWTSTVAEGGPSPEARLGVQGEEASIEG